MSTPEELQGFADAVRLEAHNVDSPQAQEIIHSLADGLEYLSKGGDEPCSPAGS